MTTIDRAKRAFAHLATVTLATLIIASATFALHATDDPSGAIERVDLGDVTEISNVAYQVQIVRTGGQGVRPRSEPRADAPNVAGVSYGPGEGAVVGGVCQIRTSSSMASGSYQNYLWHRVEWRGTFIYVNDTFTNSPSTNSQYVGGWPVCGSATASPAPAPAPAATTGPYLTSNGGVRDCTNVWLPGCAVRTTLGAGTAVAMMCWIDDANVTEAYTSARWFYITAGATRGFVHSSRVGRQTTVGHCGANRGVAAARWAAMQVGETVPNPGETAGNPMDRWSGWCYVLAWDSHALSHGVQPLRGYGSAKGTFYEYQRRGRVSTSTDHNAIPTGSIVFWTFGSYGHAVTYLGNGHAISTIGDGTSKLPNERVHISRYGAFAGWVAPGNI